jgi:hypothetical protein
MDIERNKGSVLRGWLYIVVGRLRSAQECYEYLVHYLCWQLLLNCREVSLALDIKYNNWTQLDLTVRRIGSTGRSNELIVVGPSIY